MTVPQEDPPWNHHVTQQLHRWMRFVVDGVYSYPTQRLRLASKANSEKRITRILLRAQYLRKILSPGSPRRNLLWRGSKPLPSRGFVVVVSSIQVSGYRSIRNLRMPLGRVTVVTGHNGAGKSNLYRALSLICDAARGRFASSLSTEGGMPAALWAGPRRQGPVRLSLGVTREDWSYELSCGLTKPRKSEFCLDPEIKEERIWHGATRRPTTTVLERVNGAVMVCNEEGRRSQFDGTLVASESVLSQLQEPRLYPELYVLRDHFHRWRFYHAFDTERESPVRQPRVATRTPILASDGRDLASAIQTIRESDRRDQLDVALAAAFPRSRFRVESDETIRLRLVSEVQGIQRKFEATEFSDGTLRYLCLLAALLSPAPPELLVLNEPDTSLHPELLEPLAALIAAASESTQVWLTTHSNELAQHLTDKVGIEPIRLYMKDGETLIDGQSLLDRA